MIKTDERAVRIGIVSYNIFCNFTNYGSALQSFALSQAMRRLGARPVLLRYCPGVLRDKHPLRPLAHMWDQDELSRRMVKLSMPAIEQNYWKFERFYQQRFVCSRRMYTNENFEAEIRQEHLDGFVCGSDTIFCIDEFGGFDDGYFANYEEMKQGYTFSYAASFGDATFDAKTFAQLDARLKNFRAIGLREGQMLPYVRAHADVPVERVIDPTLLLNAADYEAIEAEEPVEEPYLLLYSRRYNEEMECFAEALAQAHGWRIVEISLRATNAEKHHIMRYDAGVEEFLSLVHHAACVVTNSYHGMIFSVQYRRPFFVFSREQCDGKIDELLTLLGLETRKRYRCGDAAAASLTMDYDDVFRRLAPWRAKSLAFLQKHLREVAGFAAARGREA